MDAAPRPVHQAVARAPRNGLRALALACANVGSLLLARGAARQRELAVRIALGANRARLVRQILTESVVLAGSGSLLGILCAYLSTDLLLQIVMSGARPLGAPATLDVPVDANVLAFATGLTVIAATLFGLAPALAAFRSAPATVLRQRAVAGQSASRRLFGNGLVMAQVALSLVLLSMSQLFLGHLSGLRNHGLGFDRHSVLLASVDTGRSGRSRDQLMALYPELPSTSSAGSPACRRRQ
jgi:predicted lysophospholipase L1 biosynthesis ABC-type transport system permease subunit